RQTLENQRCKLTFKVEDTGIGISEEKLESLFNPFSQVDSSTTRKFGGTGLGLAICKQLAELMGGEMNVSSKEGQGSIFSFFLEVDVVDSEETQEVVSTGNHFDAHLADSHPLSILLAEDNFINQKLAEQVLSRMGYAISVANNGKEAIAIAKEKSFDLIFMDIHMPEMDGIQATKIILDEVPDPPRIVALTANVVNESRKECELAGMTGFIHKPFKIEEIKNSLVETHQLKQEKLQKPE
ncbi:MAG: response regulator, partial [Bacteroidota bacterium]